MAAEAAAAEVATERVAAVVAQEERKALQEQLGAGGKLMSPVPPHTVPRDSEGEGAGVGVEAADAVAAAAAAKAVATAVDAWVGTGRVARA